VDTPVVAIELPADVCAELQLLNAQERAFKHYCASKLVKAENKPTPTTITIMPGTLRLTFENSSDRVKH
jgi:hypothetical protein